MKVIEYKPSNDDNVFYIKNYLDLQIPRYRLVIQDIIISIIQDNLQNYYKSYFYEICLEVLHIVDFEVAIDLMNFTIIEKNYEWIITLKQLVLII